MFKRFSHSLAARPVTEVFLASIAWIMSLVAVEAFDRRIAESSGGIPKLDLVFGYDTATAMDTLRQFGEAGRAFYIASTWADMVFPLALSIFALLLLPRAGLRHPLLLMSPVGFLLLDVLENLALLKVVSGFPLVSTSVVETASFLTQAKLCLLAPTYLMMIASLLIVFVRWSVSLRRTSTFAPDDFGSTIRMEMKGLAAVGFVLALLLTPIQAAIWNQAETSDWIVALSWPELVGRFTIPDAYSVFGKLFACVPIASIGSLEALRRSHQRFASNRWMRVLLGLLCAALLANIGTYWVAGLENPGLRFYTFWCSEVPIWVAIAAAGCAMGFSLSQQDMGVVIWFWRLLPFAMVAGAASFEYLPHGLVLPFSASVLALVVWRRPPSNRS